MNCDASPREPTLLNIFINYIGSGIECTFSKFAGDIRLTGAGDTIKRGDHIQRDLDKLENWDHIIE